MFLAYLAAESGEARIFLVAQDEGVVEKALDIRLAVAPGPIEPLEGCLGVVAQRIDLGDLLSKTVGMLLSQRLESSVCGGPVTANLPREGERDVLPAPRDLLLRGIERRLHIAALDLDDGELPM
jgi:hypothetical protein